jgi:hypothetical protein
VIKQGEDRLELQNSYSLSVFEMRPSFFGYGFFLRELCPNSLIDRVRLDYSDINMISNTLRG